MRTTIAVYHPTLSEQYVNLLSAKVHEVDFLPAATEAEARSAIAGAEILLTHISLPPELLRDAPKLAWIQVLGAGVDRMLPGVPPNVRLTRLTGTFGVRMAEYAIGYVLAITQRIPEVVRNQTARAWQPLELGVARDRTLGVAGLGSVGTAVARLGSRIGMRVTATSTQRPANEAIDAWFAASDFARFLGSADFIVLALPATAATRHIVNRDVLPAMRAGAWLINMSRGSLVDEAALIEGLSRGRPAGAVLDVFAAEPLPDTHPFWEMPNVIVTPHHSGAAMPEEAVELFAINFAKYQRGERMHNEVDITRGY